MKTIAQRKKLSQSMRNIVICNFFVLLFSQTTASCSDWNVDASGNYSNPANWTAGVPNAVDAVANFPNIITLGRTVTLDISPTIGTLSFVTTPFSYTITPSPITNTLNMQGSSPSISLTGATSTINATVNVNTSLNISSSGGLFFSRGITGTGTVNFSGSNTIQITSTPFTYVGPTNISSGNIVTIPVNTFPTNTAVTLTGGQWLMASNQSVGSIAGTGGSIVLAGPPGKILSTGSDNTNTTFSGTITGSLALNKVGSGIFTLTGANTYSAGTTIAAGTLSISSDANLGTAPGTPTVNVTLNGGTLQSTSTFALNANRNISLASTSFFDVTDSSIWTIPSVISGAGGLTKTNAGTLNLTGVNTYTGSTTVSGGNLAVNGNITGSLVSILPGAILSGSGTVNAPVNNNGTIRPGNSIGTLTVTNQVTFAPGSNYTVEISPTTSDLLNIVGAGVTIQPGASLIVLPDVGLYPRIGENIYTIIQTTDGVSGIFSSVISSLPFQTRVVYLDDSVDLIVSLSSLVNHVGTSGNVGAVAQCLDRVAPSTDIDLDNIIIELVFVQDAEVLTHALNQMQPSLFKGFALSQENISIAIRSAMSKRAEILYQNACLRDSMHHKKCDISTKNSESNDQLCEKIPERGFTLWFDALGNLSNQRPQGHEKGFHTTSGGAIIGLDYQVVDQFYLGISGAYSHTDVDWEKQAAEGDIQSGYLSLYGIYSSQHFFINAVLSGAHNEYSGKRKIKFLDLDRRARHSNSGNEGLAYLCVGGLFQLAKNYSLNPFISTDYIYLHQNGFREHGANSLNLRVGSSNYDYLRSEAGLNFNGCIDREWGKLVPNFKFGVIREWRFKGKHFETEITGADCTFTVSGLNPDRTLFAPGASLTALLYHERVALSIAYDGEFGEHYWDQNVNFQLGYSF